MRRETPLSSPKRTRREEENGGSGAPREIKSKDKTLMKIFNSKKVASRNSIMVVTLMGKGLSISEREGILIERQRGKELWFQTQERIEIKTITTLNLTIQTMKNSSKAHLVLVRTLKVATRLMRGSHSFKML